MVVRKRSQYQNAMVGNAGLNFAAWQLSRRGWHVLPTIRNARGSDLYVTNGDETVFFGLQSKALSRRSAVPLGKDGDALRSDWWVITINACTNSPTCFIIRKEEVKALAVVDKNGAGGRWLDPRAYDRDEYRDAWDRLGDPNATLPLSSPQAPDEQNGVRRPKSQSLCGQAWAIFDQISESQGEPAAFAEALEEARAQGLNEGNVRTEFYRWRRFNGFKDRAPRRKFESVSSAAESARATMAR